MNRKGETEKPMEREIEFNNGFVTALGLFYGHRHREQFRKTSKIEGYDVRIYGASDHLYDIEYPKSLNKTLKQKIQKFVSDVFKVRLEDITAEQADKLFERCKDLLKEIDEKCFGLNVEVYYP